MSEARKCDRCSSYFEYDESMNNYIVFGNRHIIVDLKRGKDFDICPKCMKEFEDWFFPSEEETESEAEYKDPCDNCTIDIGQRRCIQCRYGYVSVEDRKKKYAEDISEAAKFVETKFSEAEYKDPCKSCHNGVCEQCDYGYCSEEDKKKRWLENHKDEVKLSDPYEEGGL